MVTRSVSAGLVSSTPSQFLMDRDCFLTSIVFTLEAGSFASVSFDPNGSSAPIVMVGSGASTEVMIQQVINLRVPLKSGQSLFASTNNDGTVVLILESNS